MTGQREHKLPLRQLTILAICRFAEPIALTSVNPYLPEMISFFVPPSSVAEWAGFAMSVFSLAQCLTGIPWGRFSDRFGRKPAIILSLFNTLITTLLWGFSTSLPMTMVVRALAGAGNGNVGVIRTAVAELVPWKELQPRAFSIMPLVWNIGSVLGPAIGGALANPLRVPPERDGQRGMRRNGDFLERYPFALPNILAAALFIISLINATLFLKESLQTRRNQYDPGTALGDRIIEFFARRMCSLKRWLQRPTAGEQEPLLKPTSHRRASIADEDFNTQSQNESKPAKYQSHTSYRDVLTKQSVLNLFVYTILATHSLGFDQLIPVYLNQERQNPSDPDISLPFHFKGGFQISTQSIGFLLTAYGIFALFIQFFIFPPAARKFGVLRVYHICSFAFPIVYVIVPYTALLPVSLPATGQHSRAVNITANSTQHSSIFQLPFNVFILFLVMLFKCTAAVFAFPCSTILLTNSASSLTVLGTLNGISTSVSAIGRAAGPAIGGNLLGWGVRRSMAWLPWWTFAGISAVGAVASLWLIEGEGFGGDEDKDDEEEVMVDGGAGVERTPRMEGQVIHRSLSNSSKASESPQRWNERRPQQLCTASSTAFQESVIEEDPENPENGDRPETTFRTHQRRKSVDSSVPIGMGKGISRRLSSNLGQSVGSQHSFGE